MRAGGEVWTELPRGMKRKGTDIFAVFTKYERRPNATYSSLNIKSDVSYHTNTLIYLFFFVS